MTERLSLHFFFYRVVLLFSQPQRTARSILVPWPRIEPSSPTVEEQSPNHSVFFYLFFWLCQDFIGTQAFFSCGKWGPLFIAGIGLLLLQSTGPRALGL